MIYVEAPQELEPDRKSIFLAGSITNAEQWQNEVIEGLKDIDIVIFNPRRKNFPMDDPTAAEAQITWEHKYLHKASMISFWFSKETLAPITLFELGTYSALLKPIVIGIDPKYKRKQDVEVQMKLSRPDIKIVYSLEDLIDFLKSLLSYL
jgi:hypothetical protein